MTYPVPLAAVRPTGSSPFSSSAETWTLRPRNSQAPAARAAHLPGSSRRARSWAVALVRSPTCGPAISKRPPVIEEAT